MSTFKLTLAYDGTGLVGWQRQPEGTSVQGLLEDALTRLTATAGVTVTGAGRTDAGVHARGQVASVTLATPAGGGRPPARRQRAPAAGGPRPRGRAGRRHASTPASAPRRSATPTTPSSGPVISPFDVRYAWHIPYPLDVAAMRAALPSLRRPPRFRRISVNRVGYRRQRADADARRGSTRNRRRAAAPGSSSPWPATASCATWSGPSPAPWSRSAADAGRPAGWPRSWPRRDRSQAGPTAPPHGLFLVSVRYC